MSKLQVAPKVTFKDVPKRWAYKHDGDVLVGQMTAMFVWHGYFQARIEFSPSELEAGGGVVGLAQQVAQYSRFLAMELQEYLGVLTTSVSSERDLQDNGWPGVFEYDVAQPYGAWLREHQLTPSVGEARTKAREMVKAFFQQN